jgi:endonuclease/exonuclease/phosphatase family metal-dependent hydrolase
MYFPKTNLLALWATLGSAASIPYTHSSQLRRQTTAGNLYFPVENATLKNARVGEYYQASVGGLTIGPGNATANFEKVGGEGWADISAEGLISGTPATGGEGSTELDLRATAEDGSTASLRITIPVRGPGEVLLERLAVMSYNLWKGGANVNNYHEKQLRFILESRADVIGLQESVDGGHAKRLAEALRWNVWQTSGSAAILSRYDVEEEYGQVGVGGGLRINLNGESANKKQINFWNAHPTAYPYGPYGFCFDNDTPEQVVEIEAESGRTPQMAELLEAMAAQLAGSSNIPVLLTGDMNAPSHLDWVASRCGVAGFEWPTSVLPARAGLIDSYRVAHPNPASVNGTTWSPIYPFNEGTTGAPEPQDRIDFVYATEQLRVLSSETMLAGNPKPYSQHENNEWTSDHRAVLTWFQLP